VANRSYLYSVDAVPDDDAPPGEIRCISQHKSRIPLAHRLLAGRNTFRCASMIWNGDVGIVGDFAGGVDLLDGFLTVLGAGEVAEPERYAATVTATREFLAARWGRYTLLECGEILELYADDPEAEVVEIVAEIGEAAALADAARAGAETPWLTDLRANWPREFDSFYSDHLFYSFRR
jgi:hypothetical protein